MAYSVGPKLPENDQELVRRLSLRWMRAAGPHNVWAKTAKRCTDYLEGRQWTEQAKATMQQIGRAPLTMNLIAPLWRLVMGYQSSTRTDATFLPTSDALSREDIGQILTVLYKIESGRMGLKYTDSEVFGDGLTTARGWWDLRLAFEKNDFGELDAVCNDPFTIYVDPDCNTYDIEKSAAYIQESVWTDLDSISSMYGPAAGEAVENLMQPAASSQLLSFLGEMDVSPQRYFGSYADDKAMGNWQDVYHTDFVDRQAKRLRLLDSQYKITSMMPCFVDLQTGAKEPIPEEWLKPENNHMIDACLSHADKLNEPIKIMNRPVKRVRWTVTCADTLLFDGWSPYKSYTKVGYFPYFRRGATKGMIDDLLDPQDEKNKKRSVLVDILNRSANSGWMYEKSSLDPEQEENLKKFGSAPGINVAWTRGALNNPEPHRIEPGNYPQGLDRIEKLFTDDMNQISGINQSAMGQLDNVQSGRAIEAKQRQAVLSIQMYSDNYSRSKALCADKSLECFQNHYTEERVYREIGEDSSMVTYEINKKQNTGTNSVIRLNDITVGKYMTVVDEVPISATFKQGQFEETMMLLEKLGKVGEALVQSAPELLIDQTSLPRKEEWKKALKEASQPQPPPEDPKIKSQERIAAANNETKLAAAAVSGIKDTAIFAPELLRLQQMNGGAQDALTASAHAPPPPAPPDMPPPSSTPVGPAATTPEGVPG